jgi:phosphoglycerate dehydrogenase-like enzyme
VPTVRHLAKYGVGLDRVDLRALDARGITLGWTPGVNASAVAEVVLARTIDHLRGLTASDAALRRGHFRQVIGREVSTITVGLLGCGHVGKAVARTFRALGAAVIAHDRRDYTDFYREYSVTPVSMDDVFSASDVVSVHVPLTLATRGLVGVHALARMKPGAILVNTARGGIVDENALAASLVSGALAGAVVDVFDEEPPTCSPLLTAPNVLLSPHLCGSSTTAVLAMGRAAILGLGVATPALSYLEHVE